MEGSSALICDVDGVLLRLLAREENLFLSTFHDLWGIRNLSSDWNSYRCRNDEDISAEILETHFGRPATGQELEYLRLSYLDRMMQDLPPVEPVPGARTLLEMATDTGLRVGIATANYRDAARLRLEAAGLWPFVQDLAFGADGGGHKRQILGRAIAATGLSLDRIAYMGDNLNDLEAAQAHGVYFIGFSEDAAQRNHLGKAGAKRVVASHEEAMALVRAWHAEVLKDESP